MYRPALLLAAAILSLTGASSYAQSQADGQWHGGLSLGGALASGNSSSRTLSAAGETSRTTTQDKTTLYGLLNYGRSTTNGVRATTADLARLGGRYDYNLSPDAFAFGGLEGETNKVGGVRSRYTLNAGAGYKLVRSESTTWDLFGGAAYTDTKFTNGKSSSGLSPMFGEESSHKLSATTTLKQRLVVYPGGGDVGRRATFDAGLATAIAGGWTLNTGLAIRYASVVPAGAKKSDTLLTAGFGYKF